MTAIHRAAIHVSGPHRVSHVDVAWSDKEGGWETIDDRQLKLRSQTGVRKTPGPESSPLIGSTAMLSGRNSAPLPKICTGMEPFSLEAQIPGANKSPSSQNNRSDTQSTARDWKKRDKWYSLWQFPDGRHGSTELHDYIQPLQPHDHTNVTRRRHQKITVRG